MLLKEKINPVVLGAATGYSPDKILPFLNSFQHANFLGKVVIFINHSQYCEYVDYYQNRAYQFELEFVKTRIGIFHSSKRLKKNYKKFIRYTSQFIVNKDAKLKQDFIHYLAPPHVSRFYDYFEYIQGRESEFSHILISDTRDVIMQDNPFSSNVQGLYLGMEDQRISIGEDSFHIKWLGDVYGKDYLKEISANQICCAGVTLGDFKSVEKYLMKMLHEFNSLPYYTMVRSNYDQGIHNKLLYSNQFDHVVQCQPLKSYIATIGIFNRDELIVDCEGYLLNRDSSKACLVHQYDRHKDIESSFYNKYLK